VVILLDLLKRYVFKTNNKLEPVIKIDFREEKIVTLYKQYITNSYPLEECENLIEISLLDYNQLLNNLYHMKNLPA